MTDEIKDRFSSRQCHPRTDTARNGWSGTTWVTLGRGVCHTHSNTAVTVEHHFPELSLLNMVQIIGYANMHNAV